MICIIVTTFIGSMIIGQEAVPVCYPTQADCERDVPRIAHLIVPVEGRSYGFRCVLEERAL
jgi:hypothetical protein